MKIGYMGIEGSFSHEASIKMSNKAELIPLVKALDVVNEFIANNIDFGILAKRNSTMGVVKETKESLKNIKYEIVKEIELPIHHCIFIKNDNIKRY